MVKEELCEKVVEVRRVCDDCHSSSFLSGCAEVDLWVYSTKPKMFGIKLFMMS